MWEIFVSSSSGKGLLIRIYKELKISNSKRISNPLNWIDGSEKEIQMANKYMKWDLANQNYSKIPSHLSQIGYLQEKTQQQKLARFVGGGGDEPSYIVGEHITDATTTKVIMEFSQKLKIDLPYDPAIPLLGIYLKNYK
jgi:hypothetical protein